MNLKSSPTSLSNTNEWVRLEISRDHMAVYAAITNFSIPTPQLASLLKQKLQQAGVRFGLDKENIKKLLLEKKPDRRLLIARGQPPEPGRASQIQKLIDFNPRKPIAFTEQLDIRFHAFRHPNLVRKGTPLVRWIPGKPSREGRTVLGEPIPVKPVPQIRVEPGEGVAPHPEKPHVFTALTDGLAFFEEPNRVWIKPVRVLERVDPGVGNIKEKGSVIVLGDVKANTRIEAGEDVEVYGVVEDARIHGHRDVIIHKGFIGHGKGLVMADRNIYLAFARYQNLQAGGNLYFEYELIGCNTTVGDRILSPRGRIISGRSEALYRIRVDVVGSPEGVQTYLVVGQDDLLRRKLSKVQEEIDAYYDRVIELKQEIYDLVLRQIDGDLNEQEEKHLQFLQRQNDLIPERIRKMENEKAQLEQALETIKRAEVIVTGDIYEKVTIQIEKKSLDIKRKLRRRRFHVVGNLIESEAYSSY